MREIMEVDCTGDETLWVFRYASYFKSVSGCEFGEAICFANAAFESWGNDPDTTPEEVASSDYGCASESLSPGSKPTGRDGETRLGSREPDQRQKTKD
jgi:hypothetical protein